jgi:hypothetical protein
MTHLNRLHWLILAAALAAGSSRIAAAQPLIPQGLDCGIAYVKVGILQANACNGVQSVINTTGTVVAQQQCNSLDTKCGSCGPFGISCITPCSVTSPSTSSCQINVAVTGSIVVKNPNPATGFAVVDDNDIGIAGANAEGFVHQEATSSTSAFQVTSDDTLSQTFVLPEGAICGFHHTANSPDVRCMGYNPANFGPKPGGCPQGWTRRIAVDASSNGQHWAWCEYQDTNGKSVGSPTVPVSGLLCGVSSTNPDNHTLGAGIPGDVSGGTFGTCMGYGVILTGQNQAICPASTQANPVVASNWNDAGAPSGQGVGYCTLTTTTLPTHAPIIPPAPVCTIDCCGDGTFCPVTFAACQAGARTHCH